MTDKAIEACIKALLNSDLFEATEDSLRIVLVEHFSGFDVWVPLYPGQDFILGEICGTREQALKEVVCDDEVIHHYVVRKVPE